MSWYEAFVFPNIACVKEYVKVIKSNQIKPGTKQPADQTHAIQLLSALLKWQFGKNTIDICFATNSTQRVTLIFFTNSHL